ncbi:hypothetical protein SAMN04488117_10278 [Celeribacter baekdonensis]|uniref:Uncharacterized protein n=1 Tax=Celeribacter baekdonensis TaxID=875171 RepID=A0A1G7HTX6_9RHOB|nr:hypothetical protein SAMN04488117_10278 [Celeribacter baekdonensis]
MTQVIEKYGGEYRNRTGVHGFAIRLRQLILLNFPVNTPVLFTTGNQGLMRKL